MTHSPAPRPASTNRPWLCALAVAVALAAAASTALAKDDDDDDFDPPARNHCSATAQTLFSACGHESKDDFLVAKAKCINLSDARDRRQCLDDARSARREAGEQCGAQLAWRRAACRVLGEARYDPDFHPDRFDRDFRSLSNPNPYFPLGIGYKWEFRGGGEFNQLEVLDETKSIAGVTCVVLRDLVYEEGRLKEATDDWYAAGRDGSTWYCGEEVKDYQSFDGDRPVRAELVSISGSFKHGREGDKAGIIMPALPRAGQAYLEEFSLGNAEDVSEILSANYAWGRNSGLDRFVPRELAQRFCGLADCVVTKNYSLLEPNVIALKYYARGIGFFLEIKPESGLALQLTHCNFDARCASLPQP
jgi:hypothetical protein